MMCYLDQPTAGPDTRSPEAREAHEATRHMWEEFSDARMQDRIVRAYIAGALAAEIRLSQRMSALARAADPTIDARNSVDPP